MGDSTSIRHSRARKCFVCGKPFEYHPVHGLISELVYRHMGDPNKYERLCMKCAANPCYGCPMKSDCHNDYTDKRNECRRYKKFIGENKEAR